MFRFLLAMTIWGTIGLFVRYIELPTAALALSRGILGTLFLLVAIWGWRRGVFASIAKRTWIRLLISGAAIGVNWIFFFEALRTTSVAVAIVCYYLAPAFIALASPIFLKERLHPVTALCVAGCFVGLAILANAQAGTETGSNHWLGICYAVFAAMLYTAVVLNNKTLDAVDSFASSAIQLGGATITLVPYVFATLPLEAWVCPLSSFWLVLILGFAHTGLAYLLWFSAIPTMRAQSIAVLSYIDPVIGVAISVLVLHEPLSLLGYAGATLVLGSMLVSEVLRIRRSEHSCNR